MVVSFESYNYENFKMADNGTTRFEEIICRISSLIL